MLRGALHLFWGRLVRLVALASSFEPGIASLPWIMQHAAPRRCGCLRLLWNGIDFLRSRVPSLLRAEIVDGRLYALGSLDGSSGCRLCCVLASGAGMSRRADRYRSSRPRSSANRAGLAADCCGRALPYNGFFRIAAHAGFMCVSRWAGLETHYASFVNLHDLSIPLHTRSPDS